MSEKAKKARAVESLREALRPVDTSVIKSIIREGSLSRRDILAALRPAQEAELMHVAEKTQAPRLVSVIRTSTKPGKRNKQADRIAKLKSETPLIEDAYTALLSTGRSGHRTHHESIIIRRVLGDLHLLPFGSYKTVGSETPIEKLRAVMMAQLSVMEKSEGLEAARYYLQISADPIRQIKGNTPSYHDPKRASRKDTVSFTSRQYHGGYIE